MSANLAVLDVSRKGQTRKIYSFEEASGGRIIFKVCSNIIPFLVTGSGDVTYNIRRRILGAIPVKLTTTYHLYNFVTSKAGDVVNLIRKSRWPSQCRSFFGEDGIYTLLHEKSILTLDI